MQSTTLDRYFPSKQENLSENSFLDNFQNQLKLCENDNWPNSEKKKKHFKKKNQEKYSLLDYINKPIHRKLELHEPKEHKTLPVQHSKSEFKKGKRNRLNNLGQLEQKKKTTKLKKIILYSRKERQKISKNCLDVEITELDEQNIDKEGTNIESTNENIIKDNSENIIKDNSENIITNEKIEKTLSLKRPKIIHSRKFREYCDNLTSDILITQTQEFLTEICRFQKNSYNKNEIKARAHRRCIFGFREVNKKLHLGKLKLVVIATDIEPCDINGGLDDIVKSMKSKCKELNCPYLFSLNKRQLMHCCLKKTPISVIGILSYDGINVLFKKLVDTVENERKRYDTELLLDLNL